MVGKDFNTNIVEGDGNAGIYDGRGDGEGGEGDGRGKEGGVLEKTDDETKNKGTEKKSRKRKSGGGFHIILIIWELRITELNMKMTQEQLS